MKDYCTFLKDELHRRTLINKSYSLRAFARDLSMSPSQLSEVMNKKRGLSPSKAVDVAKAMELDEFDTEYFVELVQAKHARSKTARVEAEKEALSKDRLLNRKIITEKHIPMLNWIGYAIRRLSEHKDFQPEPAWIADRLGISVEEVRPRLKYLLEHDFIVQKNSQWGINENLIFHFSSKVGIEKRMALFTDALEPITRAISLEDIEQKDFASHVFSLRKSQVRKIKDMIREFEDQIDKVTYETGDDPEEVFYFTSLLFPLSKKKTQ